MIKHLTVAALGLAAILVGNPVRADYLVYTNRATFDSTITGEQTDSFNELGTAVQNFGPTGLSQANGLTQPLVITGSSSFLLSGAFPGYYSSYGTILVGPISTSSTDGITVALPANTYTAAGADVASLTSAASSVSFLAKTSDGETITGTISLPASQPNSSMGFLGVALTTPGDYVTSLTFSTPVGAAQNVVVDNFSFGFSPQQVPEPASIALILTGSLALGGAAIRRRLLTRGS